MPVPREASLPEIHSERHSPADNRRRYRTAPYLYVFPAQSAHRGGTVLGMADGDTRGDGCDEYSASVRNSLSFLKFSVLSFRRSKRRIPKCSISAQEFFFFLIFSFFILHPRNLRHSAKICFTSQENLSPLWASITLHFLIHLLQLPFA